jgi:uncharacterized protein
MTEAIERHFVIDSMLGKLAKWLRILGFDAHCGQLKDQDQVDAILRQGFLLITRNRKWSRKSGVFYLTANDPSEQLQEVVRRVSILPHEIRLLQRCVLCNYRLREMTREDAFGHVPDYVYEAHSSFHHCPRCQRVYWPGSHPKRVLQRIQQQLGWAISEEGAES